MVGHEDRHLIWRREESLGDRRIAGRRMETHGDAKNRVSTAGGAGKRWVGCFNWETRGQALDPRPLK